MAEGCNSTGTKCVCVRERVCVCVGVFVCIGEPAQMA